MSLWVNRPVDFNIMRPTLFKIGALPIRGYGLMVAIAFLVATYVAARRAEKRGIPSQNIFDLGLYILISAMLGARVFHTLQHPDSYESVLDILKLWEGGLVYYGGFIFAFVVSILYLRKKKLPTGEVLDILGPSLILGVGIARIGCFLAGCCFGKPTSLPWGITYPEGSLAWFEVGSQKVHPTQLYSVLSLFSIFMILLILQKRTKFSGQLFLLSVLMYSVHRFLIDFLRYYSPDERMGGLATSQVMSIIGGVIAIAVMIFLVVRGDSGSGRSGCRGSRIGGGPVPPPRLIQGGTAPPPEPVEGDGSPCPSPWPRSGGGPGPSFPGSPGGGKEGRCAFTHLPTAAAAEPRPRSRRCRRFRRLPCRGAVAFWSHSRGRSPQSVQPRKSKRNKPAGMARYLPRASRR